MSSFEGAEFEDDSDEFSADGGSDGSLDDDELADLEVMSYQPWSSFFFLFLIILIEY